MNIVYDDFVGGMEDAGGQLGPFTQLGKGMRGLRDERRMFFGALGAAATLTSYVLYAQAPPAPTQVEAQIRAAVRRVSTKTGILVDPLIAKAMGANAQIFSGNLCYTKMEPCTATLGTPAVLDRLVTAYLNDLASRRPAEVETLASRLAASIGADIAGAGWPNSEPNSAGVIAVPDTLRGMPVALQGASGPISLGASARYVVVRPGRHTLLFGSGTTLARREVSVTSLARVALAAGQPQTVPVSAAIGRVDAPNLACGGDRTINFAGPLAYFNWGRGRQVETVAARQAALTPFATQAAIDIRVTQQSAGACNANCMKGLSIAFARAIAAWRGGCKRCGGNMLAIVRIGSNVWLDVRAADRLRAYSARLLPASDLDLTKITASEMQHTFAAETGAATVSYEQADADPSLRAEVCRYPTLPAAWFAPLRSALCGSAATGFGPLRPTLALRDSETTCGPASDFIACGTPGGLVEIVLEDSRYTVRLPNGSQTAIGPADGAPLSLQNVLVHEVGHWFGVPHAEIAGADAMLDIMSKTYDPRRSCLSTASLVMLNNAADRRWGYSVKTMMGLRRLRSGGAAR